MKAHPPIPPPPPPHTNILHPPIHPPTHPPTYPFKQAKESEAARLEAVKRLEEREEELASLQTTHLSSQAEIEGLRALLAKQKEEEEEKERGWVGEKQRYEQALEEKERQWQAAKVSGWVGGWVGHI